MDDQKTYPLGDTPSGIETNNASLNERMVTSYAENQNYRVILTGEKRSPKAGEWYLSGAIPTGYKAKNDLSSVYMIAKLVRVKRVQTVTYEVIDLPTTLK